MNRTNLLTAQAGNLPVKQQMSHIKLTDIQNAIQNWNAGHIHNTVTVIYLVIYLKPLKSKQNAGHITKCKHCRKR